MIAADESGDLCAACSPDKAAEQSEEPAPDQRKRTTTRLEQLETTDSGAVRKRDSVQWLEEIDRPSDRELIDSVTAKPSDFSGSTFPTEISNVRVTGDAEFIETIAGLLKPFLRMEDYRHRLEINLQHTNDRESDELTDNYALYLSVAERGGQ